MQVFDVRHAFGEYPKNMAPADALHRPNEVTAISTPKALQECHVALRRMSDFSPFADTAAVILQDSHICGTRS
jgi:hypothetical protein